MFIQPTPGTMICHAGRQMLFHSAPDGLWQFEDLESGEFFKWKHKDFKADAGSGAVVKVETTGSARSIVLAEPLPSNHQAMLIGLTEFESAEQARFAHAFMAYQRSGLDIEKDAPAICIAMDEACAEAKFKSITIGQLRGILSRYRRHRDVLCACTPHRRGQRLGTYRVGKRDEALIDQAIEDHYLKLEQPSIASAFRHYLRIREDDQKVHGEITGLPASQRTFERRVSRLESFEKTVRRHGVHEAKRRHRVVRGIYADVDPMEIGEMDDCYIPVMVVSDDYSHALGVPRLCSMRDRGTGYVPSFFLWCGEVSTFTALATFKNLFSDKAPLLRSAGMSEDVWLYTGPFNTVVIDRGPNLDAEAVVRAAAKLNSAVQMCPTKKAWAKPFVERLHGYVLEYIAKELPGRTFDDVVSFRAYKARVKAIIPLSALIRILVQFFVEVINGVPRPGHRATPTEEMAAWLRDHPPAVPCDLASIELLTSMPIKRTVNQEGVRWENLHFVSDELAALVRRIGHGVELTVYVNVADLGKVNVADPQTCELIPAYCTWPGYANGLTLPEHQLLCRGLRERREKIRLAALLRLQRRIQEELAGAREGKKLLGIALKAERMQQSSESEAANAPPADGKPAGTAKTPTQAARPTNQAVLDAMLF
jgi:hypothetical protein